MSLDVPEFVGRFREGSAGERSSGEGVGWEGGGALLGQGKLQGQGCLGQHLDLACRRGQQAVQGLSFGAACGRGWGRT